ncbi:MAG: phosphate acyltransferase PlsX [Oscillospiraceae bacterium]|nr:phosphate acyltransferase PlsX [Oscillospiraceae bacterium]
MRIIIDAMGGDNAPSAVVDGAFRAATDFNVAVSLVGDESKIAAYIKEKGYSNDKVSIVHASEVIAMDDNPIDVIKNKKDSSMVVAMNMLSIGEGDALVSAGNTGALVTGSTLIVKRIRNVRRAALGTLMPTKDAFMLLLDVGANSDCTPQFLHQFAVMGSVYMNKLYRLDAPKVGLVNIGTEDEKGSDVAVATNKLLKKTDLNYIGNIEARDIPAGVADVVVCDGFTGNIILKLTEGLAHVLFGKIRAVFKSNIFTKLAALLVKRKFMEFKKSMDYTEYGGAPLLGLRKPVIKAHGSSDANAFYHAIRQAVNYTKSGIIEEIATKVAADKEESADA